MGLAAGDILVKGSSSTKRLSSGITFEGVGVTMGASVFVEANYFRNCPYPMLSSMQGSDVSGGKEGTFSGETGGVIKAYNNVMESPKAYVTYQENSKAFDAYEVSKASDKVPSSVKAISGGTTYNNFDTDSSLMYKYTAQSPKEADPTDKEQSSSKSWNMKNSGFK